MTRNEIIYFLDVTSYKMPSELLNQVLIKSQLETIKTEYPLQYEVFMMDL